MVTMRVVNTYEGSRGIARGRLTASAMHEEVRITPVWVSGDPVALVEEYLWVVDGQGRQRKEHQHSRLVSRAMADEEFRLTTRKESHKVVSSWEVGVPEPVLPEGAYLWGSWNKHYPVRPVTVDDVVAYATA